MTREDFDKWVKEEAEKFTNPAGRKYSTSPILYLDKGFKAGADAAYNLLSDYSGEIKELHSIVENLKLQVSERQDRLDGVDKRNYELLEYAESLREEIERLKGLIEKRGTAKCFRY